MRRRPAPLPFALAAGALLLSGCEPPTEPARRITALPRELSVSEEQLIQATNRFGFRLLAEVAGGQPDSNIFLSPLSASMALGMTLNGAAGTTFDAMRSTLGFDALSLDEINASYRDLIALLRALDPRVRLDIGNSIWYREGFAIETEFLETVRSYFGAEAAGLDFNDPSAAEVINAWVKESTDGRITEIVESPIDPLTMAFLINAVYFKGVWTYRFDRSRTAAAPFMRLDGSTVSIPLMELEGELPYAAAPGFEAVDLPYGGEAFAMTVLLPGPGGSLDSLVAALDAQTWQAVVDGLRPVELTLFLPRFRLEYERLLNDALKAMGMGVAFDPGRADFTRMYRWAIEDELHISKVKQKSFVEVNEEGTEAAAVTSVEVGVTSAPPVMRVDRPFLFAIRERFSGTVLFLGKIVDPSA